MSLYGNCVYFLDETLWKYFRICHLWFYRIPFYLLCETEKRKCKVLSTTNIYERLSLFQYIGTQVLGFILSLAGTAVLLDNSTRDSQLQPRIRESMRRLIMNAHHKDSQDTLAMIQENVSKLNLFLFCLKAILFWYFAIRNVITTRNLWLE